jgi:transposase InsO family protein
MRENGISVERAGKFKATTDSDHKFNISRNLQDRDFNAVGANQKWAGDFSFIWIRDGWLYLAVRWCWTNAKKSQNDPQCRNLSRTNLAPLGESSGTVHFEIIT